MKKAMSDTELNACPCGCVVIEKHPSPNTTDHLMMNLQFGCVGCGMTAPCGQTMQVAKDNWNKLTELFIKGK